MCVRFEALNNQIRVRIILPLMIVVVSRWTQVIHVRCFVVAIELFESVKNQSDIEHSRTGDVTHVRCVVDIFGVVLGGVPVASLL